MKLKDLKIETLLKLIFVSIYAVVIILGVVSWHQTNALWKQTQNLYNHPLQVKQAISGLKDDIIIMDKQMKKYILENSPEKRQSILQSIDQYRKDATRHFNILYARYLGVKTDIQKVEQGFDRWNIVMDEIVDLVRAGKNKKALEMTYVNGGEGVNTTRVLAEINSIGHFADKKANEFYQEAQNEKNKIKQQLFFLLGIVLFFLLVFFLLFYRIINDPIKRLTQVTKKFSEGNYDAKVDYSAKNELGNLAQSFNQMGLTIQSQLNLEQKALHFNTTLFKREDLVHFFRVLLKEIVKLTQSQMGAVYLMNDEKTEFTLFESVGLSTKAKTRFSVRIKEGEFGKALSDKKITYLREIPEDTDFIFSTTSGDFKPREIITIPVFSEKETVAVISLASIYPYVPVTMSLLKNIFPSLTARINGVLLFHQIKEQAAQLEKQNTELEIQGKELTAQATELNRQNTELKMQKNQLDESNRLKSTFLSNMSHELRTPLNSVIALSSVLKRKLKTAIPDEEYSYIDIIERNGKHLLELINDVLDLSHIESGRIEIEQTEFNIEDLINEMVSLIEPQATEKKIALTASFKKKLPSIKSDANKIRHILQNLIGNAVKFTEKGKVEVTAVEKENYMHIMVSDTGIGIPAEQIPYIFDEFRQVDSSTSRKYGGTGLGLSISKKYARMLGGTISVLSTPGQGSVFTLVLPLEHTDKITREEDPPAPTPLVVLDEKPEIQNKERAKEKTILIVEDSEPAIIQLKDILNEAGFNVLVAHNGREALEQIAKTLPDAMILDLMMPEIDGFQVLENVRANVDTEKLPVLILTAKQIESKDLKKLKNNHIYQLLQKGNINQKKLLQIVFEMVFPEIKKSVRIKEGKPKTRRIIKIQKEEKPLIMVVEDNIDNMFTIKSMLGEDYRIIEAYDGKEGISKAKTYQPDLILMDIAMPVMNGFRAFDAIRKEKELQHIPIIAVTASAMTADRDEILHYGFDAYISKPIDINRFETIIKSFLK